MYGIMLTSRLDVNRVPHPQSHRPSKISPHKVKAGLSSIPQPNRRVRRAEPTRYRLADVGG